MSSQWRCDAAANGVGREANGIADSSDVGRLCGQRTRRVEQYAPHARVRFERVFNGSWSADSNARKWTERPKADKYSWRHTGHPYLRVPFGPATLAKRLRADLSLSLSISRSPFEGLAAQAQASEWRDDLVARRHSRERAGQRARPDESDASCGGPDQPGVPARDEELLSWRH
eukprot:scaffold1519_cov250-Pinguiococcus_pyrenoidosus.AAC.1